MMESEYICDYCSRSFTRKYNLLTHIENCHLNESCYCVICGQRFGSPAGLQLHLSRGHNRFGKALPECDVCGRIFTRRQNIISHMVTVHLQVLTPIKCNLCSKFFTTERNMKRHVRHIHNPKQFLTCDECQKIFRRKRSLMHHIQTVHAKNFLQNTFQKIYTNTSLKPEAECNVNTHLKCKFCSKLYTSNYILKRHIRTVHVLCVDKLKYYTCKYCCTSVIGRNNFRKHAIVCHDKKRNGIYQYLDDLTTLSLICDTCNANFDEENSLRQHIRKYHDFQDFYDYCKKSLLVKAIEKKYVKKMIYNCEFCSKNFGSSCDLKYHRYINHSVEYFCSTCKVCYSTFSRNESFTMHKKFCFPPPNVKSCSYCDKMFTNLSSLEFHIKIFHPLIPINDSSITSSTKECNEHLKRNKRCSNEISHKSHTTRDYVDKKTPELRSEDYRTFDSYKSILGYRGSSININKSYNILTHSKASHRCIECSTDFKEKRTLRRHIRSKHLNCTKFPRCHICKVLFESKKSCSRHLKYAHNILAGSGIPMKTEEHNNFYKCEVCQVIFKENTLFKEHKKIHMPSANSLPRCIICVKYFSSRKTLKRHIKKFHSDFQTDELADFGTHKQDFTVTCEECIQNFTDKFHFGVYQKWKHVPNVIVFKCETCKSSYNCLEYAIQRYKQNFDISKSKLYLSELCTTEMSDTESHVSQLEPVSSTVDIKSEPISIKSDPDSSEESEHQNIKKQFDFNVECNIKSEPLVPGWI